MTSVTPAVNVPDDADSGAAKASLEKSPLGNLAGIKQSLLSVPGSKSGSGSHTPVVPNAK